MKYDVAIVGGGIVGLATASYLVKAHPGRKLVVLEKEAAVACHQTGRNSGVIHSGIYYKPGSLKARNCAAGREDMYRFCAEHGVAHERCGKRSSSVGDHPHSPRFVGHGQAQRSNVADGGQPPIDHQAGNCNTNGMPRVISAVTRMNPRPGLKLRED